MGWGVIAGFHFRLQVDGPITGGGRELLTEGTGLLAVVCSIRPKSIQKHHRLMLSQFCLAQTVPITNLFPNWLFEKEFKKLHSVQYLGEIGLTVSHSDWLILSNSPISQAINHSIPWKGYPS